MGTVDEHEVGKQLRQLPEDPPDYSAMWARIEQETASRTAGWATGRQMSEAAALPMMSELAMNTDKKYWRKRALLLSLTVAACLTLIPVLNLRVGTNQAGAVIEVGQKIGKTATLGGATLSLDGAAVSRIGFSGESRLSLFMSLAIPGSQKYEEIIFEEQNLTDLKTGEQYTLPQAGFEVDSRSGVLSRSFDLSGLDILEGKRNYRLNAAGLLLRSTRDIPLHEAKAGTAYPIPSGPSDTLTIHSVDRKDSRLIVQYSLTESGQNSNSLPFYMDDRRLEWKVGNRSIRAGNTRTDGEGLHTDTFYLTGFSEQQIKRGELHFLYMNTVNKIAGDWRIDFTADFDQARKPAVRYALHSDPTLESQAGITLRELSLSPLQIEILYDRQQKTDIENPEGRLFTYQKVELRAGEEIIEGQQIDPKDGVPGDSRFWFSSDNRDWQNQPLTLLLSDPLMVSRDLKTPWTPLASAATRKQTATSKLNHKYEVKYTYYRKGNNLIVQTVVPKSIAVLYGTVLKVNGSIIHPDPNNSWFSVDYNRRTDQFNDVPEGAILEINPGSYGYIDTSKNLIIPVKE